MIKPNFTIKIKFNTIDQVKSFINEMDTLESDAVIRTENNKYAVDARSIMGIFSLDLTNNLLLDVFGEGEKDKLINITKNLGILIEEV